MTTARLSLIFFAIAVAGAAASGNTRFNQARLKARIFVLPLPQVIERAGYATIGFVQLWTDVTNLAAQNSELREKNLELQAKLIMVDKIKQENELLRQELMLDNFVGARQTVVARVAAASVEGFFQTITIDQGANSGIHSGNPVLSSGFLAGVVGETTDNAATVKLVIAHTIAIPVEMTRSRAKGLLRGGVKGLVVEDIPIDAVLGAGEPIMTAGLINNIPAGIAVGEIDSIISTKGDIFQTAKVKSPINFNQLNIVTVIK